MGKKNKRKSAKDGAEGAANSREKAACQRLIQDLMEKCSGNPAKAPLDEWEEHLVIRQLVEELMEKQRGEGFSEEVHNRAAGFEKFHQWLSDNGAKYEKVRLCQLDNGECGLCARQEIQNGEKFLSIPSRLLMTVENASQSVLGPLIARDRLLQVMPNVVLAVHLLFEVYKQDSFWTPYFNILPRNFSTPIHFSVDELQLLQGSPVLGEALNQYKSIARQYCYLHKLFQGCKEFPFVDKFTFRDYRWSVSLVMTRQNQVPICGGKKMSLALIPLLDMANHTHGEITTDFDLESESCICYALKNTNQGEQVCIFYGPRTNAEFLLHAGFVFDDNAYDKVQVKLGIGKGDPLNKKKFEALEKLGMSVPRLFDIHYGPSPCSGELLVFLRVFCMNEGELDTLYSSDPSQWFQRLADPDILVSESNEDKIWTFLETRCMLLLRHYPQTMEEDAQLLEDEALSSCARVAIKQRLAEKRLFSSTMDFAKRSKKITLVK